MTFSESVEFQANTDATITTFLEQAGHGTVTFTSIAAVDRADVVTGDFVIVETLPMPR